ncbi:hypothetical protein AB0A77_01920 [Streptomyces varsoviensis]|uniref:hypothetical protein n=1 Tax=Streptomyces varsoviensis TaxID=67373 RepID=UPI0033CF4A22
MNAYMVKGTTDDVTDCELCGRTELKGTVVLASLDADGNEDGSISYFGTHCASKAAGWTVQEVNERVRQAARKAKSEDRERACAEREREGREFKKYLRKTYGNDTPWAVKHYGTYALWQDFRASRAEPAKAPCGRKARMKPCREDALYCSEECSSLVNDPTPAQPVVLSPAYFVSIEEPVDGYTIETFRGLTEKEAVRKVVEYQAVYAVDTDLPDHLMPPLYVVDVQA